jgi:hypothetical protein
LEADGILHIFLNAGLYRHLSPGSSRERTVCRGQYLIGRLPVSKRGDRFPIDSGVNIHNLD